MVYLSLKDAEWTLVSSSESGLKDGIHPLLAIRVHSYLLSRVPVNQRKQRGRLGGISWPVNEGCTGGVQIIDGVNQFIREISVLEYSEVTPVCLV